MDIKLTSPDKVLWPEDGISKQELAGYFAALAEPMLRALADRPLAFQRWPGGIQGKSFYQQNVSPQPWMQVAETPTTDGSVKHLIVDRPEALRWLAQQNALTLHMWHARRADVMHPDWVVFDFDPADGHGIAQAIEPALALRRLLDELALPSAPKTSGKRGLHVLVPVARGVHTHEETAAFAFAVGAQLAARLPGVTVERAKAARKGRLYLDCLQNGYGKLVVAPYSPRAVAGAPVSAPLTWDEVTPALDPKRYTLRSMPERLAQVGDLFAPALAGAARLPSF